MSILDKILGYKKEEVAVAKTKANTAELEARAKDTRRDQESQPVQGPDPRRFRSARAGHGL